MNNNLQSYFNSAKNVRNKQTLINNDEIVSLVENNTPTTSLSSSHNSTSIIIAIATIFSIGGAVVFMNTKYSPNTNENPVISKVNKSNNTNQDSDNFIAKSIEEKSSIETPILINKRYKKPQPLQTNANLNQESENQSETIEQKSVRTKDIEGLKVIELSEDEAFVLAAYYPKLYTWLNKNYSATDTCDITLTPATSTQENITPELHSVIFLKIRHDLVEQNPKSEEFILWFTPTIEFADALPERYKFQFQKELKARYQVETNCLPAERACKTMKGSSPFFDLCRRESGALSSVTISPNPAFDRAECTFMLLSERDIYISLHEVTGRFVKTMIHNEPKSPGEQKVPLLLQGIPAGAYLVAISTSQGEKAVIQLIIQQQ